MVSALDTFKLSNLVMELLSKVTSAMQFFSEGSEIYNMLEQEKRKLQSSATEQPAAKRPCQSQTVTEFAEEILDKKHDMTSAFSSFIVNDHVNCLIHG